MVMSRLLRSMTAEISENFLLYETAHEVWEVAREFYSNYENTSIIFEVESTIYELRQGELNVTQYYNSLTHNWQQLDIFEDHQWSCPEDAKKYIKIVEQKRIFRFLVGLNKSIDEVRSRVLSTKPLMDIHPSNPIDILPEYSYPGNHKKTRIHHRY